MRIVHLPMIKVTALSLSLLTATAAYSPARAEGLPQLDISTFPPQLIWLAITFFVLYFAMSKMALPRIGQVLEERQHKIEDNLKKAETLKEEAKAAAEAYESAMAEARAEAHGIMLDVHKKIADEQASRMGALGEKLDADIKAAEERIQNAKEDALKALGEVAIDVTRSAIEKLTGDAVKEADINEAVNSAMEGRN